MRTVFVMTEVAPAFIRVFAVLLVDETLMTLVKGERLILSFVLQGCGASIRQGKTLKYIVFIE
jgi:hypothetical protein